MSDVFDESVKFADLGLRGSVLKGVEKAGFVHPTFIQAQLIRPAMQGKDIIGQAKTGTGKTAAFGLPILHQADKDTPMQALILTPTRELAAQVASELDELGQFTPIRTACIIGGESMRKQIDAVHKGGAHILVGTPGRIMDLHGRRQINFDKVRFCVLDEVDRMLDIGFRDDIRKILKSIQGEHQTIFVSATISDEIERLGRSFLREDAERITSVSGSLTAEMVDQKYFSVEPWDKRALLLYVIRQENPETLLVFCRTKATVSKICKYLRSKGLEAREIHGDMPQNKRTRVMKSLREGNANIVIASDLAARGLDVEHITHVINYDLPEDPEVYVHRIGRTARAGRRGSAWSFATPEEGKLLTQIEKLTGVLIEETKFDSFTPGPVPDDIREARQREDQRRSKVVTPEAHAAERAAKSVQTHDELSDEELAKRFPNGVIPKNAPRKTLGSRFRTRRSR